MYHPAPPRPAGPLSIGGVLRDAHFMRPGTHAMLNAPLHDQAALLFDRLRAHRVTFVLVGGLALLQYVPARSTVDIDLIVALAHLRRVPELVIESSNPNFARCHFGDLVVDALLTRNHLFNTVRKQHTTMRPFAEGNIPCATVEGLLLLKLYALPSLYRQGDFARVNLYEGDIVALLHAYDPPLAPLMAELAHHLSAEDQAAVEEVLDDLTLRVQRFRSKGATQAPQNGGKHTEGPVS